MAFNEKEAKCFTFLWKLENISYCLEKKGEGISSPSFVVDAIDRTKWELMLYPRGHRNGMYVGVFLHRKWVTACADKVEVKYEFAFMAKDGSVLRSLNGSKSTFTTNLGLGYPEFEKREDVFISRRTAFLPEDVLTVRCRMWKTVGQMEEDVRLMAHTRIGIQKRSFLWKVKNFNSLQPYTKCTYQIKSTENGIPLMSIDLSLTGGLSSDEMIHFDLFLQENIFHIFKFAALRLSLVDAAGNKVKGNQDEFWFNSILKHKEFTLTFRKEKLLSNKSIYLPGDILSLHWEWVFSKGIVLQEIEEGYYECAHSKTQMSDLVNVANEKIPHSHILNENLKYLYNAQFLCDVTLKTTTGEFPAHKIILSASSSVFKAMFSNNMKEKVDNCVTIENFNDDTVRRMLLYIYTARIENVTWESASHLYVAADKYDILSLKNMCSSYLKDNLSPSNACEILLMADFHADDDLKFDVQDYILNHDEDIINSAKWQLLMEAHSKLAAETLCLRYK